MSEPNLFLIQIFEIQLIVFISLYNIIKINFNLDPLDPLTEIINSGEAFSISIVLEKVIWGVIGFFLLGAIFTSIKNSVGKINLFNKKYFFNNSKPKNHKEDISKQFSNDDNQNLF